MTTSDDRDSENVVLSNVNARSAARREFFETSAEIRSLQEAFDRKRTWPADPNHLNSTQKRDEWRRTKAIENPKDYPENASLLAEIIARPDDDAPRRAYAEWMGGQAEITPVIPPDAIAWFVGAQLDIASALRANPKADTGLFLQESPTARHSLHSSRRGLMAGYGRWEIESVRELVERPQFFRGFIEHVAMKAKYFLMFAEEIYSLAPIRHLTLTYCGEHIEELAASPHLARIRSLNLPNRMLNNHYTRLNELTDEHIRVLASSPHLGKLAYLDLEDNTALTPRALDHLASSTQLPSLSHVRLDHYDYHRQWGEWGDYQRTLSTRRTVDWTVELEDRHGYLPWLHADEHYGSWEPDVEAVVEHPVGDAAFRPDVAALRHPPLPPALVTALRERIDLRDHTIRDAALVVALPEGRLVATLEQATPEGPRTLVRLTVQQGLPGLQLHDVATGRLVAATARTTLTLRLLPAPPAPAPAPEPTEPDRSYSGGGW